MINLLLGVIVMQVSFGLEPLQELGKHLYFEKRLSKDNTISCNSCHNIVAGAAGIDGTPVSTGIGGAQGGRNAPTVWNSKHWSVQFWDGRARDLAEQAKGPITNPIEMGMPNHDVAIKKIAKIEGYQKMFKKAFSGQAEPITMDNLAQAIQAFEETLVTQPSPFDRFRNGDTDAISKTAKAGWETFQSVGCVSCHSGENFNGPKLPTGRGFYMRFPTYDAPELEKKYGFKADKGRYEHTKKKSHKYMWRVPSLRNVAITAPYFHNGKVNTLEEAVVVMGKTQLGLDLSKQQVSEITAFLKSITGKRPSIFEPKPL